MIKEKRKKWNWSLHSLCIFTIEDFYDCICSSILIYFLCILFRYGVWNVLTNVYQFNHHYNLDIKHFQTPRKFPSVLPRHPCTHHLWPHHHWPAFCHYGLDLSLLEFHKKWKHTVCTLPCLASLTKHMVVEIHSCCIYQYFVLFIVE
jgi:hypothetical protein